MGRHADPTRHPCPWVIVSDFGSGFAIGSIGGGVWHFAKGAKNSPSGYRFNGAISAVKSRAPVLGGNFAVWGGLFSTFDCALMEIRGKQDPWNSIASGFLTGGALACRAGLTNCLVSATFGGVILGLIEGVSILAGKMMAQPPPSMAAPAPQ
ncbi:mitochondrial import inner membrane translocase, subunit Tim17/22 [Conidiobolus coronatus NRRL 28638]|jgi:import inner membrane translocase subunit TIM17|uniref:Mitochondrial import inner membrane translocase, subunit Tim17/22 n=1 Tax=Conidiobolus coronatus (strain ATCC 28846 / CBS 209.66 / NRRL 28638) TaxID=796925 RepID=A0A137P6G2_CONC2|nr:mitochondrial import inner membrane translocase, subunit Tim17/22 [Conidiobolus coronatus NRRL 28638]|eukprot:KXN70549.1 mitochondrial import inner membrane translocase, subunit Tim17/22 [Conidiobolus coronatus NRRL 28638]